MTDPPAESLRGYDAAPEAGPRGPVPSDGDADLAGYPARPTDGSAARRSANGANGDRDARGAGGHAAGDGAGGPRRARGGDESAPPVQPRPESPPPEPRRPRQVFIPAPEDLPPFDEVVEPIYPRREPVLVPDPGPAGPAGGDIAAAPLLAPGEEPPPAPDLSRPGAARGSAAGDARSDRRTVDRRRIAVVYDVDGPRVRLGLAWFAGVMVATAVSPVALAGVLAVAAAFAARQLVRAWGSVSWQVDVATGLGALPVLAALVGTRAIVGAVVLALVVAVGASFAPGGPRLPGSGGRLAAAGILAMAVVPAVGGACAVLVRSESIIAALVLVLVASAYEVGDYIVGSGASNPVEGPLAGITTATLVALPLALVLVEPYDAAGVILLAFTAVACPLGQLLASAVLPGAGAYAPALRRIDTLLVLAPLWAAAAGAF